MDFRPYISSYLLLNAIFISSRERDVRIIARERIPRLDLSREERAIISLYRLYDAKPLIDRDVKTHQTSREISTPLDR